MATKEKAAELTGQTCPKCGGIIGADGSCGVCGYRPGGAPAKGAVIPPKAPGKKEAGPKPEPKPGDDLMEKWMKGEVGDNGLVAWIGGEPAKPAAEKGDKTNDALKRWLMGEDDALKDWIGGEKPAAAPMAAEAADKYLEMELQLKERDADLSKREQSIEAEQAEVDELKKTLTQELREIRLGAFDPVRYVEDLAMLQKQLQSEIKRRKELQEDIEHTKKGTVAIVKYLKAQQLRGASPTLKKKLDEEKEARAQLDTQLKLVREQMATMQEQLGGKLQELPPDARALKEQEIAIAQREAELKAQAEDLARQVEALKTAAPVATAAVSEEELQARLQEELREKEEQFLTREEELKKKILGLEEEIGKLQIDEKLRQERIELGAKAPGEVGKELERRITELQLKEKTLLLREQENERLRNELKMLEEEFRKAKEPLQYKEDELLRREQDLLYREQKLEGEWKKVEQLKAEGAGSIEEMDMKRRLEELQGQVNQKEEELRAREQYIRNKMEELRLREQGLIEQDIEARAEERMAEVKQEKGKTGTPRLDDLMLGGIPFGTNVIAFGPPYVGKEVLANSFAAEGLKKGIPVIWVLTEKTPADLREEMEFVLRGYEEYERRGLVKYVDAYSMSVGIGEEEDPTVTYVDDPTAAGKIGKAVDTISAELKKKHAYYRLVFRSVSTLIAYLDSQTAFKFLQPFAGRRKRDKAVAFFMLEKGMHGDQDIQSIKSIMDGMVEFKVENLKTFLRVEGVGDVQSRAWIGYSYNKQGVYLGSFSLELIR